MATNEFGEITRVRNVAGRGLIQHPKDGNWTKRDPALGRFKAMKFADQPFRRTQRED